MSRNHPPKKTPAQVQVELRSRRKGSYHLVATKNQLVSSPEDEEDDILFNYLTRNRAGEEIARAKAELYRALAKGAGDATNPVFEHDLDNLLHLHNPAVFDARSLPPRRPKSQRKGSLFKAEQPNQAPTVEGMWISLQKPRFQDCLGTNKDGYFQYTLGRMTFGMFQPSDLVCSIQGTFNPVHIVDGSDTESIKQVPRSLFSEVREGSNVLRSYDVVTAFTIEPRDPKFGPSSPNQKVDRPIEGLLTTKGFALPNPDVPNRLTVWFTEGSIEVDSDTRRWKQIFEPYSNSHQGAKELEEANFQGTLSPNGTIEADGRMSYKLNTPAGGHDKSYIDILYLDESMRIMKSNRGDVYIFAKVPYFPDE